MSKNNECYQHYWSEWNSYSSYDLGLIKGEFRKCGLCGEIERRGL